MKRLILITILSAVAAGSLFADYPPEGWTDSITEAIAEAEREDKMLLLDFTGSDWCGWCKRLDNEVWKTQVFQNWADDNLVMVFLDFPQSIELSDEIRKQNYILQQMLGVQGYPTIWLLDSDLTPLLRTGYREGGPEEYIRHLTEDQLALAESDADGFRTGFRSGIEEHIGSID